MDPVHKGLIIFGAAVAGSIVVDLARENYRLKKSLEKELVRNNAVWNVIDKLNPTFTPEQMRIFKKAADSEIAFVRLAFGDSKDKL